MNKEIKMENLEIKLEEIVERILSEKYITQEQLEESLKDHENKLIKEFQIEKRLNEMYNDLSYNIDSTISKDGNFRKYKTLFMIEDYKRKEFLAYIEELGYEKVNDYMLHLLEKKIEKEKKSPEYDELF